MNLLFLPVPLSQRVQPVMNFPDILILYDPVRPQASGQVLDFFFKMLFMSLEQDIKF